MWGIDGQHNSTISVMTFTHSFITMAFCFLMTFPVSGIANDGAPSCGKIVPRSQYNPPDTSTDGCTCGLSLHNVSIPLKNPFRLNAACNLRWIGFGDQKDQAIDLSKEQVSFERYKNDYEVYGELLLIGTATLQGTLRYEEGPAGKWWFNPNGKPIISRGPLEHEIASLKLTRDHTLQEFHVPHLLHKAACWEAKAVVRISNIWLRISDSDEAGAYPAKYSVTSVSNHHRCN